MFSQPVALQALCDYALCVIVCTGGVCECKYIYILYRILQTLDGHRALLEHFLSLPNILLKCLPTCCLWRREKIKIGCVYPRGGEPLFAVTADCVWLHFDSGPWNKGRKKTKPSKNSKAAVCGLFFLGKIHLQNECCSHVGMSFPGKEWNAGYGPQDLRESVQSKARSSFCMNL